MSTNEQKFEVAERFEGASHEDKSRLEYVLRQFSSREAALAVCLEKYEYATVIFHDHRDPNSQIEVYASKPHDSAAGDWEPNPVWHARFPGDTPFFDRPKSDDPKEAQEIAVDSFYDWRNPHGRADDYSADFVIAPAGRLEVWLEEQQAVLRAQISKVQAVPGSRAGVEKRERRIEKLTAKLGRFEQVSGSLFPKTAAPDVAADYLPAPEPAQESAPRL